MTRLHLPRGYRDAEHLNNNLHSVPEERWLAKGQRRALHLFHAMAKRVPAYKDFLRSQNFDPASVKSFRDFARIPSLDKDNYLRKYPREALCWDGDFANGLWVISTTSGSTGQPYYFPRERSQDWQYAITAELYLRNNFVIQNKRTLYIVAFPMGAWIGGLFTYEAIKIAAENGGYDLSIITPGIHKKGVIDAIKHLGDSYDQIIIGAYAPFLKDIIDDGASEGVEWNRYNLGFIFSAEAFSEAFRDYIFRATGIKDQLRSTLNHYGTVDLGTMAHETPESVMIRRHLVKNNSLSLIFPESKRQPTFAQYNPELFYFESSNSNLYCTAYGGIPLVRYDLKDYGGVLTRTEVHDKLAQSGFDVTAQARAAGIDKLLWNLPYVYVYERNDFSISYYAFQIYPDTVRRVIQSDSYPMLTGKFTMVSDYDASGRQRLNINIEAKYGIKANDSLISNLQESLHQGLMEESSEYRETFRMVGEEAKPVIMVWDYEDPRYFKPGSKQQWVKK